MRSVHFRVNEILLISFEQRIPEGTNNAYLISRMSVESHTLMVSSMVVPTQWYWLAVYASA